MDDPITGSVGSALGDVIGELFDIPEANLDGQMLEMVSGDDSYQESSSEKTSSGTNANAKDDGLDAALIDLIPIP
jgi:hypothetical protein